MCKSSILKKAAHFLTFKNLFKQDKVVNSASLNLLDADKLKI